MQGGELFSQEDYLELMKLGFGQQKGMGGFGIGRFYWFFLGGTSGEGGYKDYLWMFDIDYQIDVCVFY